jgi:hypothetical protein
VATTTRVPPRFSTIAEIEEADKKLGSFTSDLDWIRSEAEAIDTGREIPLDLAFAMDKAGIEPETTYPYEHDDRAFARLLVFAGDVEADAEMIRKDATKLRDALLSIYRHQVTDPEPRDDDGRGA